MAAIAPSPSSTHLKPQVRLGSSSSCSAEYGFTISPKNVTFKVRSNRGSVRGRVSRQVTKHHRRTRSDPLQPLSHTKLLSEEINQLQKKKHKLENGTPLNGWNGKEKKKLQEAIDSVLEEKRKKQLGKIKRRTHRLEELFNRRSDDDIEEDSWTAIAYGTTATTVSTSLTRTMMFDLSTEGTRPVGGSLRSARDSPATAVAEPLVSSLSGPPSLGSKEVRAPRPVRKAKSANGRRRAHSKSPSRSCSIFDPRFWSSPASATAAAVPSDVAVTGNSINWPPAPAHSRSKSSKHGKSELNNLWVSSEDTFSTAPSTRAVRCSTVSSTEFKHIIKEGSPKDAKPLKKRPSWEKFFPMQKSKVVKGKSPREGESRRVGSAIFTSGKDSFLRGGSGGAPPAAPAPAPGHSGLPGGVSPRLEERCIVLDRWLKGRPTWKEVFERGLFNTKAKLKGKGNSPINLSTNAAVPASGGGDLSSSGERDKERERIVHHHNQHHHQKRPGEREQVVAAQRSVSLRELFARLEKELNADAPSDLKERMRSSTDALERLLQERPSWVELMERGIGKDEKKDQRKKEKCKRTLRYLLRKRKEKEVQTQKGAGLVDTYFEIGRPLSNDPGALSAVGGPQPADAYPAAKHAGDASGHDGAPFHEVNFFHLDFVGPIGGGCYGNVYEAFMKGETQKVAVKILKKDLFQPEKAYKREVEALKRTIKSPYTVNLRGYCTDPYFCIVTELCEGGSLDNVLRKAQSKLTLDQAVRVGREVAEGMKYLHALKPPIMHRDLSLGNIFLHPSVEGRVCIGDFGVAVDKPKRGSVRFSKNGNPRYRAPEVSNGEPYSRKADVYSFGNLLFELLTNQKPFAEVEDNKVAELIAKGCTPRFPDSCAVPERLRRLVERCWRFTPSERPSFKKVAAFLEDLSDERAALAMLAE